MRDKEREREKERLTNKKHRHKLRTCRVAVVGFMILLHLSHTQPEGGNAIKYAKSYASANENSKRQSVEKTEKEMGKV